jgi:hypothetical protein
LLIDKKFFFITNVYRLYNATTTRHRRLSV